MFEELKKKRTYNKLTKKAEKMKDTNKKALDTFKEIVDSEIIQVDKYLEDKKAVIEKAKEAYKMALEHPDESFCVLHVSHETKNGQKEFIAHIEHKESGFVWINKENPYDGYIPHGFVEIIAFDNPEPMSDEALTEEIEKNFEENYKRFIKRLVGECWALYHNEINGIRERMKPVYIERQEEVKEMFRKFNEARRNNDDPAHKYYKLLMTGTDDVIFEIKECTKLFVKETQMGLAADITPESDDIEAEYERILVNLDKRINPELIGSFGKQVAQCETFANIDLDEIHKAITIESKF